MAAAAVMEYIKLIWAPPESSLRGRIKDPHFFFLGIWTPLHIARLRELMEAYGLSGTLASSADQKQFQRVVRAMNTDSMEFVRCIYRIRAINKHNVAMATKGKLKRCILHIDPSTEQKNAVDALALRLQDQAALKRQKHADKKRSQAAIALVHGGVYPKYPSRSCLASSRRTCMTPRAEPLRVSFKSSIATICPNALSVPYTSDSESDSSLEFEDPPAGSSMAINPLLERRRLVEQRSALANRDVVCSSGGGRPPDPV